MEEPLRGLVPVLLTALEGLDDAALFAVMARAQGLLLDRPVAPHSSVPLAVEIVDGEEGRLLASYRVLPSSARQRLLAHAAQLRCGSPQPTERPLPAVRPPATVPALAGIDTRLHTRVWRGEARR